MGKFRLKKRVKVLVFISRVESALEEGMMDLIQRIPETSIHVVGTSDQVLPEDAVLLHLAELPLNWNSSSSQRLLVFREHWNPVDMVVWKRRGASGWLDLLDPAEEIRNCVTEAVAGRVPVATSRCRPFLGRMDDLLDSRLGCRLTRREIELLCCLGEGLSSKEIAKRFGISVHTVEAHRKTVYRKLGVHSTVQLIRKIENLAIRPMPLVLLNPCTSGIFSLI